MFALTNNTAEQIFIPVSWATFVSISLGQFPRNEIAILKETCAFLF